MSNVNRLGAPWESKLGEVETFGYCPTVYGNYEYEQLCTYGTGTDVFVGCQQCEQKYMQKQRLEMANTGPGGVPFPTCVPDGAPVSIGGGCSTCEACTV